MGCMFMSFYAYIQVCILDRCPGALPFRLVANFLECRYDNDQGVKRVNCERSCVIQKASNG